MCIFVCAYVQSTSSSTTKCVYLSVSRYVKERGTQRVWPGKEREVSAHISSPLSKKHYFNTVHLINYIFKPRFHASLESICCSGNAKKNEKLSKKKKWGSFESFKPILATHLSKLAKEKNVFGAT